MTTFTQQSLKAVVVLFAVLMLLGTGSAALAQTNETNSQNSVAAARAERQAKMEEYRRDRINQLMDRMTKRLESTIDRLHDVADRLETKAEQAEAERGSNIAPVLEHLANARAELDAAEAAISNIDDAADDALENNSLGEPLSGLREAVREVRARIRAAHQELSEASFDYVVAWNFAESTVIEYNLDEARKDN